MKKQLFILFAVLPLVFAAPTLWAKKKKKEVNYFNAPYDSKVSMNSFHQHMRESFGELLCGEEGHFKSCYKISSENCHSEVKKHYQQCAKVYKKQKTIRVYKTGMVTGHNLGLCIGQRFHQKHRDKFVRKPACE